MLHQFIVTHRDEIISRCRGKAAARMGGMAPREGVGEGIPVFLDQLAEALRLGARTHPAIGGTATRHGHLLRAKGFSVGQVVHDYGDVCQSITEMAVEMKANVGAGEFATLNLCLDDAIAGAVTEYARQGEQQSVEAAATRHSEHWAFFTHEVRNLVNTALLSFEVLRTGSVGVSGSTGGILFRSLTGLRAIAAQGEAGIRLTQGIQRSERIDVREFVGEVGANAALDARTRELHFTLSPIEAGVAVAGDRQVLGAVLLNLLQNAFKFTRPSTGVVLRVVMSEDRVCIEVEDACGGLPGKNPEELFRPFEQRGADRTGLGLGLAFSRWGAEANNGRIYARSLPDHGCVFTLDLPRLASPAFVVAH